MEIYFGVEDKYINVTYICHKKLVSNHILRIPATDTKRCEYFGDPIYGTLKHIKINGVIYPHDQEIVLKCPEMTDDQLSRYRKDWWNSTGKFIDSPQEKLARLHEHLCLDFGSLRDEYPEQLMAMTYISEKDTVLEIGGNIGRNSCVIASILNDDSRLIVLECGEIYAKQLEHNRDNNYFNFQIENSALSKVGLIQKEWNTFVSETVPEGYTKVSTITFSELKDKYSLNFNVLVADCEGALYQILKDEPNFLRDIVTIIIENDFHELEKKEYVHDKFIEDGFTAIYTQRGGWGPCYSCFFQVWRKID